VTLSEQDRAAVAPQVMEVTSQPAPDLAAAAVPPFAPAAAAPVPPTAAGRSEAAAADVQQHDAGRKVPAAADARLADAAAPMELQSLGERVAMSRVAADLRELVLPAPDGLVLWRTSGRGNVQRSSDRGATWHSQATGSTAPVLAGSAPSSSVCWLVGRAGAIVKSTDGRSWQVVAFPERVDLIAISAADDRTATVTTVDGRRFSTTDGGTSWKQ
jgi:hypothetical protein